MLHIRPCSNLKEHGHVQRVQVETTDILLLILSWQSGKSDLGILESWVEYFDTLPNVQNTGALEISPTEESLGDCPVIYSM